jgi:hypothetical protein
MSKKVRLGGFGYALSIYHQVSALKIKILLSATDNLKDCLTIQHSISSPLYPLQTFCLFLSQDLGTLVDDGLLEDGRLSLSRI